MSFVRHITARQLSVAALAIWCCSLALTGLVLYGKQRHLPGFELLASGWLSPLVSNFAWFANVFFLYAIFHLRSGGVPARSAVLASLLSLDTFRLSLYPLDEGGGTSPVYGYGWGAVLWFVSIFVMLVAVGTRRRETDACNQSQGMQERLQPFGIVLLSITLGATSYFAIHDRMVANPAEAQRLTSIAFKRGKVCSAPEPVVTDPIRNLHGPVEVVIEKTVVQAKYPFAQIKDLLNWGIPIVRIENVDYSYESTAPNGLLSSVPAVGAPAAILFVNESYRRTIRVKLVEASTNRTVFEQPWGEMKPGNTTYYCPDYESFPSLDEQPRQLLTQALSLHVTQSTSREITQEARVVDNIKGSIVAQKYGGITRAMKIAQWKELHPDDKTSGPYHEIVNANCPSDIGWNSRFSELTHTTGRPFMVKGKAYYLPHHGAYDARASTICEGDFAYIYYGIAGLAQDGKYSLNIQKRDLRDFRQVWAGIVVIAGMSRSIRNDMLTVHSVKQATDAVTIELVNEDSGQILVVQAPLHGK